MGRTTMAIVSGTAALLAAAAGCSSASAVAGARDAAVGDVQSTAMVDGESEASVGVGVESDASVTSSAACTSAGGVCMGASTCTVVGPVHCGPGVLCCLAMTAVVVSADDAGGTPTANGCATSNCPDGASASASADAAAE